MGGALLAAVFLFPPWAVLPLLLLIAFLAFWEFYALLEARQIPRFNVVGTIAGLLLIASTWLAHHFDCPLRGEVEGIVLFAGFALILMRQLFHAKAERPWDSLAGTLLGVMYVGFLFNFIIKLLTAWGDDTGRMLLLFLVVVVKCTDIGAYSVGCAIGRHKLIPRVSPAKTWEGVIGGLLIGTGAGLLFWQFAGPRLAEFAWSPLTVAAVGAVLSVAGIIGDLIESLLKRASGVKDSGRLILGMGGILDVLDSLLFAAPLLYIAARLF